MTISFKNWLLQTEMFGGSQVATPNPTSGIGTTANRQVTPLEKDIRGAAATALPGQGHKAIKDTVQKWAGKTKAEINKPLDPEAAKRLAGELDALTNLANANVLK